MSDDLTIPIVEEEATILKRSVETERVSVRTSSEEEQVLVRDEVRRELEERLVIEKRLFLVEELHLRRAVEHQAVELSTTLRRTRVAIEREDLEHQEKH
jgi:stress response protein YsnF